MFLNTQKYRGAFGEIKFSQAESKSQFQGKTKGLALKYVAKGIENYRLNGATIQLKKGQFLLFKEEEKYDVFFENKKSPIEGICIDLNLNLDEKLIDLYKNELLFKTTFDCAAFSPLGNSFQNFTLKINEKVNGLEVLNSISSQLISFSSEVLDLEMRLDSFAKKTETKRVLISKLIASKDFIYKNYNNKITLNRLALESGISKFHFSRLFKNCFEQSPAEMQEFLRMQKAKLLILERDIRLTEIAFNLGYSDLASFSNQFKKHFGVSPSYLSKN
jgi:AraC-like DNA-binding protein